MPIFTQVNLHKAEQASVLLGRELEGKNNRIALLTEPRSFQNQVTCLPRGSRITYHRSLCTADPAPRAAILTTRDISATALDNLCTRDCAAALIRLHGRQVLVASVYLDIKRAVTPAWLTKIIDTATAKHWPLILGIDSNAHSTLYLSLIHI